MSGKGRDREEGRVTVVLGGGCDCLDASMHENPQQFCLALQVGCSWLSGSVVAAETHLCRAQSAVVYPISVCLHVLGALDAPLGSASSPVADLRQACPPLEVAHKQVLHSTVGAARQQHGNGLPVVAVAGLRLQAEGGGVEGHMHMHMLLCCFSQLWLLPVASCKLLLHPVALGTDGSSWWGLSQLQSWRLRLLCCCSPAAIALVSLTSTTTAISHSVKGLLRGCSMSGLRKLRHLRSRDRNTCVRTHACKPAAE